MTMTQPIERPAQSQTCATCPFFNPEQGVHGWCGAFDRMAKPYHKSTATCDQEVTALEKDAVSQAQTPQPVDEYQQGLTDGQRDAEQRLHPIYEEALDEYAKGYVQGYQSISNSAQQTEAIRQPAGWAVVLDDRWNLYQAWVDGRCIGHASTDESAERLARRYIATDKMIQRQNALVTAG